MSVLLKCISQLKGDRTIEFVTLVNFKCCFSKQNSSLSSECLCRLVGDFQKNSVTFTETSFCVFLCIEMMSRHLSSLAVGSWICCSEFAGQLNNLRLVRCVLKASNPESYDSRSVVRHLESFKNEIFHLHLPFGQISFASSRLRRFIIVIRPPEMRSVTYI